MRVDLDRKALFALASDTRLDILKSLEPMRRTLSQVAAAVDVDKAAVFRHLKKLEEGGLVRRYEDHGFVYYGLTWRARDVLSPGENTRIVILLASYVLALTVAVAACWMILHEGFADSLLPPKSGGEVNPEGSLPALLAFCSASSLAAAVTLWASMRLLRKPRQPLGGEATAILSDDSAEPGDRVPGNHE